VTWKGSLREGGGEITATGSGALRGPVTWKARAEEGQPQTSPEELIAAAHATCFAMALSSALGQAGHQPEELEVAATATFDYGGDQGPHISQIRLQLRGRVPGIDEAKFREAAEGAKEGCPVSKALKGNVQIQLDATLA
jgi:osmotically inducible protein OsmC